MASLWRDLRFAVRLLVKGRWFTAAAMLALALGIGANNAVFTIVNAVLLRDLPFDQSDRLVALDTRDARGRTNLASLKDFADWQSASRSFAGLAVTLSTSGFFLGDEGRAPESFRGTFMSADGFRVLHVQPVLGRAFTADDDRAGAPAAAIISHDVWTNRYGGDRSIVGRAVRLNAFPATIVGVMPEGMKFPNNSDIWLAQSQLSAGTREAPRSQRSHPVFARLADGVTLAQARAEMATIGAQLAQTYPDTNKGMVPFVTPFAEWMFGPQIRLLFFSLLGAVGFVLLIACANVANLLLARAADRAREVSVRVALGATRARIVRQLLVESIVLAVVSGVLGLGLSMAGIRWFEVETASIGIPNWIAFELDARVFAFFALVCVATGIVFGVVPAFHVSKTNVNEVLKEGGRSGSGGARARRWTGALIVTELVLTLVLLAGAGYMTRSFLVLYRMDVGLDTSQLMTVNMYLSRRVYPTVESRREVLKRLDERFSATPAIGKTTTASSLPYGGGLSAQLAVDGHPPDAGVAAPAVTWISVGPRYFDTLGLRLLRGRVFDDTDGPPGHEHAVVNQRFVDLHLAGKDPLGTRVRLSLTGGLPLGLAQGSQTSWLTIVGVVPNVRQRSFQDPDPDAVVYVPHLGDPFLGTPMPLLIRTPGDPAKVMPLIREQVGQIDRDLPLADVRTMDQWLEMTRWSARVFGSMFGLFAGIALLLAAVGLYAVTAYSVTQRTQEIGLRMALGAQPGQVRWLILRRGLIQLAIGLALGMAGAVGVGRLLRSMLVQIGPADPLTLAAIVLVLVVVGLVACLWPARRATQLDPANALRYE